MKHKAPIITADSVLGETLGLTLARGAIVDSHSVRPVVCPLLSLPLYSPPQLTST